MCQYARVEGGKERCAIKADSAGYAQSDARLMFTLPGILSCTVEEQVRGPLLLLQYIGLLRVFFGVKWKNMCAALP